ncbi:hypothetical protein AB0M29_17680 [Streptomyces sp. NPDC051976]|jgi:hypothetical protein|uniref:hypothetical protein n=1 Tax=Streptomyces sp. NPDC051976 TaxID=3154947 RepID=UPI0034147955
MTATDRTVARTTPSVATYLRCFPYDTFGTGPHLKAVLDHARELSLPTPYVFFDNGRLASGPLPELRRLLDAVATGFYDVVILPGPFVLSMDDAKAQAIVRQITDHGCRVIELPSRNADPEESSRRQPSTPGAPVSA